MFFFLLPVGVDYEARRYPMVTFTLMGVNGFVFLLSLLALFTGGHGAFQRFVNVLGLIPADVHLYAFFTSMFTHAGLFHILGNMVYLFLFGAVVEDRIGRGLFVLFYFLGGFLSGLAQVMLSTGAGAGLPMVGASGAISACLGGFLLLEPKTRINFRYWGLFIFRWLSGDFWIPAWVCLSLWFLEDLFSLVVSSGDSSRGGVAFAAHIGGFLAGLGLIALSRAWRERASSPEPAPVRVSVPAPTIYLWHEGVQTGPFTNAQVRDMLALGAIPGEAVYWSEGMADWRSVVDM